MNQQQLGSWLSSAFGQLHNGEFEIGLQQLVHAQRRTPLKLSHSRDEMLRHSALQARALYQEAIVNSARVYKLLDPNQELQADETEQVELAADSVLLASTGSFWQLCVHCRSRLVNGWPRNRRGRSIRPLVLAACMPSHFKLLCQGQVLFLSGWFLEAVARL